MMLKCWWRSLMVWVESLERGNFKRALANDSAWHRLSEKSLPICKRCYQTTGTSSALCVSLYQSICRNWRHPSWF
ncbi:hypothetical protein ACULNC_02810 [Shigella flexneri]